MQLSKLENEVYEKIKKNQMNVFRIRELVVLLGFNREKTYNIIKALKKKKAIKNAGNGFLSLLGTDEFVIATSINSPSYISFLSALNYYGLSDNLPHNIFIATTKYSKQMGNFKYVTLDKKRFFGYVKIGEIIIAEKEKAVVDSLLFPKYSNGISELIKLIKEYHNILDIKKLIEFAERANSKAVLRRMGYILERTGYKKLNRIKRKIGRGFELLDPSLPRKNNLNKSWLLDINT